MNALPPRGLLEQQAAWLQPARARLLRQVGIAHRRRILDMGAGYGIVTDELLRRGGGTVIALDRVVSALKTSPPAAVRVGGDAHQLPFANQSFDLVFCQCVLLWIEALATAVAEIERILQPGGVFIAIEPDYAAMIEYPPELATRDIWLAVLNRVGADPLVGRKLPGLLANAGLQVQVRLLDELTPPHAARFAFLRTLPLSTEEEKALSQIESVSKTDPKAWAHIAHLPFVLIRAVK